MVCDDNLFVVDESVESDSAERYYTKLAAAFVRGANVDLMRYVYTILGGAIIGLAGPTYSLSVKAGWKGTISGLDGIGWIALAITIFGGWNPLRAAFGAYLFALLQWLGLVLQPSLPGIPSQVLQVAPFPLMIMTLLFVNIGNTEWVDRTLAGLPESTRRFMSRLLRSLRASPPASRNVSPPRIAISSSVSRQSATNDGTATASRFTPLAPSSLSTSSVYGRIHGVRPSRDWNVTVYPPGASPSREAIPRAVA